MSKEAQDIFDGLYRTLPTRWDGDNIVVNDAVVITAPYRAEDCRVGGGQQAGMLGRVKKVVSAPGKMIWFSKDQWLILITIQLENERRRLMEKSNKVVPAVPAMPAVLAGGQRKGG